MNIGEIKAMARQGGYAVRECRDLDRIQLPGEVDDGLKAFSVTPLDGARTFGSYVVRGQGALLRLVQKLV